MLVELEHLSVQEYHVSIGNVKGWPWGLVGFCDFFKGFLIISQILGQMLYFIERK